VSIRDITPIFTVFRIVLAWSSAFIPVLREHGRKSSVSDQIA